MTRERYRQNARDARLGNLGSLACSLGGNQYAWFLREVYDLRFPRVGSSRHPNFPRSFDSYRGGSRSRIAGRKLLAGRS